MDPTPPTKQQIEDWLDKLGKSRVWLAEQLNVSADTVKGWLSAGRPITGPSVILLWQLMSPKAEIAPEFTLQEWEQIEELASQDGITPREWIKRTLKRALQNESQPATKPAAPAVNHGAKPVNIAGSPRDFSGSSALDKAAEPQATGTGPKMRQPTSYGSSKPRKK